MDRVFCYDILASCVLLLVLIRFTLRKIGRSRCQAGCLPPGPTGLPLLGNILDLPTDTEGPHWAKHSKIYGVFCLFLRALFDWLWCMHRSNKLDCGFRTTDHIPEWCKNCVRAFKQKVGAIFGSARFCFWRWIVCSFLLYHEPLIIILLLTAKSLRCGAKYILLLLRYCERFRATRKLMHQFMGTRASVLRFEPLYESEIKKLMLRTLRDPKQVRAHIHKYGLKGLSV